MYHKLAAVFPGMAARQALLLFCVMDPAGNHVFETLDAVYHKLAAKDKGIAQVLRLQWEGSRLSYAHERGKEVSCTRFRH